MDIKISASARIIGQISIGNSSIIAQGTVIRSENNSVSIGSGSMVLENSSVIGTTNYPVKIGDSTVIGHKSIIKGCTIGSMSEIGNGVQILPGASVGDKCILGEGAIVLPGQHIPDNTVVVGRPSVKLRDLTDKDLDMILSLRTNLQFDTKTNYMINGGESMENLYSYNNKYPNISDDVIIYDTAEITGDVSIGSGSIIGAGVKIIGDGHGPVIIGENVQILENSVLHLLPSNKLIIEDNVTIGASCIVHGCTIKEGSVISSGAIICDNSTIGSSSLVEYGALVKQNDTFENNSIISGFPATKIGNITDVKRPDWAISNRS